MSNAEPSEMTVWMPLDFPITTRALGWLATSLSDPIRRFLVRQIVLEAEKRGYTVVDGYEVMESRITGVAGNEIACTFAVMVTGRRPEGEGEVLP